MPDLAQGNRGPSPSPSPLQAPTRPRYRRPPSGSKAATGSRATRWVTNGRRRLHDLSSPGRTAFVVSRRWKASRLASTRRRWASSPPLPTTCFWTTSSSRRKTGSLPRQGSVARNAGRGDRDRRAGPGYRRSRLPVRLGIRGGEDDLRQAHSRAPGHSVQAGGHADQEGRAAPHPRGSLDEGPRDARTEAGAARSSTPRRWLTRSPTTRFRF